MIIIWHFISRRLFSCRTTANIVQSKVHWIETQMATFAPQRLGGSKQSPNNQITNANELKVILFAVKWLFVPLVPHQIGALGSKQCYKSDNKCAAAAALSDPGTINTTGKWQNAHGKRANTVESGAAGLCVHIQIGRPNHNNSKSADYHQLTNVNNITRIIVCVYTSIVHFSHNKYSRRPIFYLLTFSM